MATKRAVISAGDVTRTAGVDWRVIAEFLLGMPTDLGVNRVLQHLGIQHGVDRAWIVRYNEAVSHCWDTHEWARPGIQPFVHDLQGAPVAFGWWMHEKMGRNEVVRLGSREELPADAVELRRDFQRQGIDSFLAVPIFWEGRLVFQIGYDAVRQPIRWTDAHEADLRQAGGLVALKFFAEPPVTAGSFPPADPTSPRVLLHDGSTCYSVDEAEILWIEAEGDYSRIHRRGHSPVLELKSLRAWERELAPERFRRVHRGAIVNLGQITRLVRKDGEWKISLAGVADPVRVGRSHHDGIRHHLAL